MPVEGVVMPPKLTVPPGASIAEPGVFKSLHGLVRLVDLRVRFGVDEDDFTKPGRIVIVEVEGGHAGFWVDEIEDVVSFPESGWSQVPAYIPRNVFSRVLTQKENIRLYADFEQLDKFKTSGYLRKHIEKIKKAEAEKIADVRSKEAYKSTVANSVVQTAEVSAEVNQKIKDNKKIKSDVSSVSNKNEENKINSVASVLTGANKIHEQKHIFKKEDDRLVKARPLYSEGKENLKNKKENYKKPDISKVIPGGIKMNAGTDKINITSKSESNSYENKYKKIDSVRPYEVDNSADNTVLWVGIAVVFFAGIIYLLIDAFDSEETGGSSRYYIANKKSEVIENIKDSSDIKYDEIVGVNDRSIVRDFSTEDKAVEISKNEHGVLIVINEYDETDVTGNDETDDFIGPDIEVEKNKIEILSDDFNDKKVIDEASDKESEKSNEDKLLLDNDELAGSSSEEKTNEGRLIKEEKFDSKESLAVEEEPAKEVSSNEETVSLTRKHIHVVVKGDTLWFIAKKYVNNPWRYPELAKLSRIKNPDLIYPGDRVTIIINYKNN
ncbi:MAG: hypothetical protein DIZ80_11295 [endosymbiont of Galathealinum brachiosum]|uniref:LysM domain-containing protein n=1 Tax=endosymbiont of Galathealinum brachiosum TaxID=2200906 RepID=A0A370DD69_9GAMM|nr:MAG: hypothetical protein DIZ80_11295 [endosymbiont of Galathealinum brachiosum]